MLERKITLVVTLAAALAAAPALRAGEGFEVSNMDPAADACTDFYQYACGGWMARNPIPPDQSRWGRFDELAQRNREALRAILEGVQADDPRRDALDRRIGDCYAACMDEGAIEVRGVKPLKPEIDRIDALKTKAELAALLAHLHAGGVRALFGFGSEQDFKDATQVIATVDQGGLALPDRDYYLKDDPKSVELRKQYVEHVQRMFALLGDAPDAAAAQARTVMEIETALAKASLDRVSRREPANIYHRMTRQDLASLSPSFAWEGYFQGTPAPGFDGLNVTVPDFFKGLESQLQSAGLAAWKTYLRWHLVHASASLLPAAFVNEDFAFFGRTLTGAREIRPRWKRCVQIVDRDLGEALGRRYVERTFGQEGKQRTSRMVAALEQAMATDIKALPWMTEETKKAALAKLEAITNKIGYPDRWRDYSGLTITRGDAVGNARRAQAFEFERDLAKIGRPVDKKEWGMTPPTVNAYYNPLQNNINFPAGILQPPFYENRLDEAVNFGGIGSVIGHELTHGFDDEGRKFDADGNLRDWWTEADAREFEKRARCLVDQYAGYTAVADVKLNGQLTLGENTADNGGVRIAYMALMDTLAGKNVGRIDGFTPEQRLFLGWAQVWCQNRTDEVARMLAQVDPHSPGRYRVNGIVSNMPEFQQAFGCKAGAPMVRENACRVW